MSTQDRDSNTAPPRIDLEAAIAILHELKKTATHDDLVALHRALLPTVDAPQPRTTDLTHVEAVNPSIIRRKSLFASGVATKFEAAKKLARSKTTSKDKESRKSVDATPVNSCFQLQDAFQQQSRSITPLESNYLQLGMHRLGSLRVTNGAVTPEIVSTPMVSAFDARQEIHSEPLSGESVLGLIQGHESSAQLDPTNVSRDGPLLHISAAGSISPAASTRRLPGGPRQPLFIRKKTTDSILSTTTATGISSLQRLYTPEASTNPFLLPQDLVQNEFGDDSEGTDSKCTNHGHEISTDDPMHSPILDDDTSVYSAYPRLTVRPASVNNIITTINEGPSPGPERENSRTDSLVHPDGQALRVSIDRMCTGKADSGYETDTSSQITSAALVDRTINRRHLVASGLFDTPPKGSSSREHCDQSSARRSMDSGKLLSGPPTPWSGPSADSASLEYPFPTVSPRETMDASNNGNELSSGFSTSLTSKNGTPSPLTKKLTKKRPKSVPTLPFPQLQANKLTLIEIPPVPAEMAIKHARRLTMNPGMEHLEHTFDSASCIDSQDRAISPNWEFEQPLVFPSPSIPLKLGTPGDQGRVSRQADPKSPSRSRGFFRSRSRKREEREKSASSVGGDNDVGANLADFDIVAHSLGADGPYCAVNSSVIRNRSDQVDPVVYPPPHQISSRPRAKTTVCMDEKTASEFAMLRSRDRLPNTSLNGGSPMQRNSRFSGSRGEWPSKRPRPKSLYADSRPPIPALPTPTDPALRPRPKSVHVTGFVPENNGGVNHLPDNFTMNLSTAESATSGVSILQSGQRIPRKAVAGNFQRKPVDADQIETGESHDEESSQRVATSANIQKDTHSNAKVPPLCLGVSLRPTLSTRLTDTSRPSSPLPSILARAAFFERAANVGALPMPPPSSGKL